MAKKIKKLNKPKKKGKVLKQDVPDFPYHLSNLNIKPGRGSALIC